MMDPRNGNHPQRFVAKSVLKPRTTEALRERLQMDWALQRICGIDTRKAIPDAATFSRSAN